MYRVTHFAIIVLMLCGLSQVFAQMELWGPQGQSLISSAGDQTGIVAVRASRGFVFTAWNDTRGTHPAVYWTFLDSSGISPAVPGGSFPVDGSNASTQSNPSILWDSSSFNPGGVIVWQGNGTGNYDIYAQRIKLPHTFQWNNNAPDTVCAAAGNQTVPKVIPGPAGGYYVVWQDSGRIAANGYDIYAQRLDAFGNPMWGSGGKGLVSFPGDQTEFSAIPDGKGGLILVWLDNRVPSSPTTIYAQRFDSGGTHIWQPLNGGVKIDNVPVSDTLVSAVTDDAGGAIITWQSVQPPAAGSDTNIYAQRVDSMGFVLWGNMNVTVCSAANAQSHPVIMSDDSGGAYIAWQDRRSGLFANIYAQRLDASGNAKWAANGVVVSQKNQSDKDGLALGNDGQGGAIAVWNNIQIPQGVRVYIQRISPSGNMLWAQDGINVAIIGADEKNCAPVTLTWTSGAGPITDVCALWEDSRTLAGTGIDIYGQRFGFSPRIMTSPASLQFGTRRVRTTATDTLYAKNVGDDTLTITNDFLFKNQGAGAAPFAVTNTASFAEKIPPGDSGVISVSFTPQSNAPVADSLKISNTTYGADSAYQFPVSGAGKFPHVFMSADSINFGNVRLRDTARATVLLINTGTDTLHFVNENFSGVGVTSYTDAGTNYQSVAPGDTVVIKLSFIPKSVSAKPAAYTIIADDSASHVIALSGVGTYPKVILTRQSVQFGFVRDSTTAQQSVGIVNSGTDALHIVSDTLAGDTTHYVITGLSVPATVVPGDTLFVTVSFTPTAPQTSLANLTLVTDDSIGLYKIFMFGRGTNSKLAFTPGAIDFGARAVKTTNDTSIAVTYAGKDTAKIIAAVVIGESDFKLGSSLPISVWGSHPQSIQIQYTPDSVHADSAVIAIVATYTSDLTKFDTTVIVLTGSGKNSTFVRETAGAPEGITLSQNYPNPADANSATTTIEFSADRYIPGVELALFDMLGRRVMDMYRGAVQAGSYHVRLNTAQIPAGSYIYTLQTGTGSVSRELKIVK